MVPVTSEIDAATNRTHRVTRTQVFLPRWVRVFFCYTFEDLFDGVQMAGNVDTKNMTKIEDGIPTIGKHVADGRQM